MMQAVRTVRRRLHNPGQRIRMSTVRNAALAATGLMAAGIAIGLMGTGGSYALWTSSVTVNAGTITSGRLTATVSGFEDLGVTYKTGVTSVTKAVTISNTGNVPAAYTADLAASTSASGYLAAVSVRAWKMTAPNCSTGAPAAASTWNQVLELSGNIAADSAVVYCIRSSMDTEHAASIASGSSLIATIAAKLTVGGWFATANDSATQTFTDDSAPLTPAAPTASSVTPTSITLNWSAPSDNVGVTGYSVYRDSAPYKDVSTTSLVESVAAGSSHTYSVKARDGAGNWSLMSPELSVTTPAVDGALRYTITNVGNKQCVEAKGSGTTAPTDLKHVKCKARVNQTWKFSPSGSGYFTVSPGYTTTADLVWDVNGTGAADQTQVFLWGRKTSGIENQQWKIVLVINGQFQIISVKNPTECLDAGGRASGAANKTMRQMTCNPHNKAQLFTLAPVQGYMIQSLIADPTVTPPASLGDAATNAPSTTATTDPSASSATSSSSSSGTPSGTVPGATTPAGPTATAAAATSPTDQAPNTVPLAPAGPPATTPTGRATPAPTAPVAPVSPPAPAAPDAPATPAPAAALNVTPSKESDQQGVTP